jgi:hypothetical protein
MASNPSKLAWEVKEVIRKGYKEWESFADPITPLSVYLAAAIEKFIVEKIPKKKEFIKADKLEIPTLVSMLKQKMEIKIYNDWITDLKKNLGLEA